jgi:hypothetical protein
MSSSAASLLPNSLLIEPSLHPPSLYNRTTYIVYVLDSLASLELPSAPSHVLPSELASFPLPASDELWLAPDEAAWSHAMHAASYSVSNSTVARPPMTLCHLLYRLCHPHTHGSLSGGAGAEILRLGPFGWLVGVLALLKAALDCGEGRERDPGADWLNGIPDEQLPAAINQALEFVRLFPLLLLIRSFLLNSI